MRSQSKRPLFMLFGIFCGGFVGGLLREALGLICPATSHFCYATCIANLIGACALGCLHSALYTSRRQWLKNCLLTGILGAFTTFSTFITEVSTLFQSNLWLAVGYCLGTVVLGLGLYATSFIAVRSAIQHASSREGVSL